MRILCVAEKPSIARSLADILSSGRYDAQAGEHKLCRNYVFPYRVPQSLQSQIRGAAGDAEVVMTSVLGHLMGIDFIEHKEWSKEPPELLFSADIVKSVPEDKVSLRRNLEKQARLAVCLVVWTDCDREGENIGAEIAQVCTAANRSLVVRRARFSVIQSAEIRRAFDTMGNIDMLQSIAVDVRSELDLRIGAAYTRFLTIRLRDFIPNAMNKLQQFTRTGVISYGSCQFPTLGFVVEQYKKVQEFIAEPFWKLEAKFITQDQGSETTVLSWEHTRNFDFEVTRALFLSIKSRNPSIITNPSDIPVALLSSNFIEAKTEVPAVVTDLSSQPRRRFKPLPLTTVELQKIGTKFLKATSDEIMKAAETLYQKGYVSYPRTETNEFEDSFDLIKLIKLLAEDSRYADFARELLESPCYSEGNGRAGATSANCRPRKGGKNDKAHPSIHPTKAMRNKDTAIADGIMPGSLMYRVYDFIARRFLAACSRDAVGSETSLVVKTFAEFEFGPLRVNDAPDGQVFKGKGLQVTDEGYLKIYRPFDKWTGASLPAVFEKSMHITINAVVLSSGETLPPLLLTEAELIGLMDKYQIGTDATIHEHIKKVQERGYIRARNDARFEPTLLGLALADGVEHSLGGTHLTQPFLRAAVENDLEAIANGQKSKQEVVEQTVLAYQSVYRKLVINSSILEDAFHYHMRSIIQNNAQNGENNDQRSHGFSCECGQEARLLTVTKDGPNRGRKFYACGIGRTGCNFFEWAIDIAPQTTSTQQPNARGQRGGRARGRARAQSQTNESRSGSSSTRGGRGRGGARARGRRGRN